MSAALALPVVVPLLTGVLVLPFTGRPRPQRALSLASAALVLAAAVLLAARAAAPDLVVLRIGRWDPRVGVVWVADALTGVVLVLAALTSLAALVHAPAALRGPREPRYFYPLHHFMMTGVNGALVTGDYFNLFVFFEVMLLASFALISLGARPAQLRRVFPYVTVNLVASLLFLGGVGAVYGTAGTVNMAELSRRAATQALPAAFWSAAALLLLVFAVKAALAPVFTWLPDSYPEAPIPVNAAFSGLLTKVGVYVLFRSVSLLGGRELTALHAGLLVAAGATMLLGVVGALGRDTLRGVLSFHIVSQIGYLVLGLALFTPRALAAAIFFMAHLIPAKLALFLAVGAAERVAGTGALFGGARGVARTHPWIAAGFFVPALSLAGLPPFSGFFGKLFLLIEAYRAGAWVIATLALGVSFLTLASMLKIWVAVFWGAPAGQPAPALGRDPSMVAATLATASLSVATALLAPPLLRYAELAAAQLAEPALYLTAVLAGGGAVPAGSAP